MVLGVCDVVHGCAIRGRLSKGCSGMAAQLKWKTLLACVGAGGVVLLMGWC